MWLGVNTSLESCCRLLPADMSPAMAKSWSRMSALECSTSSLSTSAHPAQRIASHWASMHPQGGLVLTWPCPDLEQNRSASVRHHRRLVHPKCASQIAREADSAAASLLKNKCKTPLRPTRCNTMQRSTEMMASPHPPLRAGLHRRPHLPFAPSPPASPAPVSARQWPASCARSNGAAVTPRVPAPSLRRTLQVDFIFLLVGCSNLSCTEKTSGH
jgi:hypothetical protein